MESELKPLPSSETSMTIVEPFWDAARRIVPVRGFPTPFAFGSLFNTVIRGIADHMHQRILDFFQNPFVDRYPFTPGILSALPSAVPWQCHEAFWETC